MEFCFYPFYGHYGMWKCCYKISPPLLATHLKAEKLTGLSLTISLLDVSNEFYRIAHRALRRLQSDLRCKYSSTQTTLSFWLK